MTSNKIVQSLWIGSRLSTLERLCIQSFLDNGHEFHLYSYDHVEGMPEGTIRKDAAKIMPYKRIVFADFPESHAAFADFFRYSLLKACGGWWVDMDMICLRPFDIPTDYVFCSTALDDKRYQPNNSTLKVPQGCAFIESCINQCYELEDKTMYWGATGPRLISEMIYKYGMYGFILTPNVFCETRGLVWDSILDPDIDWSCLDISYAVHLWNEMWRRDGKDKDAKYPDNCLYEKLKRRYNVDPR